MKEEEIDKIFVENQHARDRMPQASLWDRLEQELDAESVVPGQATSPRSNLRWLAAAGLAILLLPALWFVRQQLQPEEVLSQQTEEVRNLDQQTANGASTLVKGNGTSSDSEKSKVEDALADGQLGAGQVSESEGKTEHQLAESKAAGEKNRTLEKRTVTAQNHQSVRRSTKSARQNAKQASSKTANSSNIDVASEGNGGSPGEGKTLWQEEAVTSEVETSDEIAIKESQPDGPHDTRAQTGPAGPAGAIGASSAAVDPKSITGSAAPAPALASGAGANAPKAQALEESTAFDTATEVETLSGLSHEMDSEKLKTAAGKEKMPATPHASSWKDRLVGKWVSEKQVIEVWERFDNFIVVTFPNGEKSTKQIFDQPNIGVHGSSQYAYTISRDSHSMMIFEGHSSEDSHTYIYSIVDGDKVQVSIFLSAEDDDPIEQYVLSRLP